MSGQPRPRHARAEIRAFADWLDRGGWSYETVDSKGHTVWSHPRATGRFKLPETPRRFDVHRARRDVERLLGQRHQGKRKTGPKSKRQRQDFALGQAMKTPARAWSPAAAPPAAAPARAKRLPWEEQADDYNHAIDRLMREAPGRN